MATAKTAESLGASLIVEFGAGAEEMAYRMLAQMPGYIARIDGRDVQIANFDYDGPALSVHSWDEVTGAAAVDARWKW